MAKIERFEGNPIVHPEMDDRIGGNINGPSVIRVPDWMENPLGRYYLYFAHHQGKFIRMAYADDLRGPYTVYSPGVLNIEDTAFKNHIASPDVHVDDENRTLYVYYHGSGPTKPGAQGQLTCYAESKDGLRFVSDEVYQGPPYLRIFEWGGIYYGIHGGGERDLYRSRDRRSAFEQGPVLDIEGETFTDMSTVDQRDPEAKIYRVRHVGLHRRGHEMDIYYTNVGDDPERIKMTTVDLRGDWTTWKGSAFVEILRSDTDYEGVDLPIAPSRGGSSHVPVHEVRDPELYEEDGRLYLLYSVAGESGLGGAELIR